MQPVPIGKGTLIDRLHLLSAKFTNCVTEVYLKRQKIGWSNFNKNLSKISW